MMTFVPSMGVGFAGSLIAAIALAADWYLWKFRYWMFRASVSPSPGPGYVIHVPSASGRELVVNSFEQWCGRETASLQAGVESLDIREQG